MNCLSCFCCYELSALLLALLSDLELTSSSASLSDGESS